MAWTRHGYQIILEDGHPRPPIARCGGPGICVECSIDSEKALTMEAISEIDRNARAYGWETHKLGKLVYIMTFSEDNPFINPNWRDNINKEK